MHTNGPKEDPLVELGYEIRDVNYKGLRKAIIYFFGFGIFCALIGAFIYTNRFTIFMLEEPKPSIDATLARNIPPKPNPLLQNNVVSKTDIAEMRQRETKRLTGTGYVDETQTIAYIPIDRAMELIAERGISPTGKNVNVSDVAATPVQEAAPTTPEPAPSTTDAPTHEPAASTSTTANH